MGGGGPGDAGELRLRSVRRSTAEGRRRGPGAATGRPRAPGAVPYLPGSCREGRRGSARIPGLNVLPLSPYPSIQLGLLPLASPWKKSLEEKKRKINHAAEKGQPRSAGGSSEPGGSVPLGRGRPARAPPPREPLPRPPSPGSPPMSARPRRPSRRAARPFALGFQRGPLGVGRGGGTSWAGTGAVGLRRWPRGAREPGPRGCSVRPGSPIPAAAQAEEAQRPRTACRAPP